MRRVHPVGLLCSATCTTTTALGNTAIIMSSNPAFHRLLTFFARRSGSPSKQHITFLDSLRGDLSLGLNFPLALFLALTRHLVFRNTGFLSLTIHVPTCRTQRQLLGGVGKFAIDEERRYTAGELVQAVKPGGLIVQGDALGLWMLAADRKDGRVSGEEARLFQKGEIMERIAARRRGRDDVLPFWRGGPIW